MGCLHEEYDITVTNQTDLNLQFTLMITTSLAHR